MDSSQIDYHNAIKNLDEFGSLLCGLIKELLEEGGIQVHSVTYRVKDFESTLRKLNIKGDKYSAAADLTDLLGVRVVTYFSEDVDKVDGIIRGQFTIDEANSIDKRKILDANQFGYLSLHLVAEMSTSRSRLTEYKRYKNKKFELQIRSILQHAWAEIEHDLGYKAKSGLPDPLKRRFSRLAGSLELADEEFERLRKEISEYETKVDAVIKDSPQTLPINQSTLIASFENEDPLNALDRVVAEARHSKVRKDIDVSYVVNQGENLKILGINNIEQLHDYAKKYLNHVKRFAEVWLASSSNPENLTPAYRGIGMFFLNYTLAAQRDEDELTSWGFNIANRNGSLLKRIKDTWKKVVEELGEPQP